MRRVVSYYYTIGDCGGTSGYDCSGGNSSVIWDNSFDPSIPAALFQERRTAPLSSTTPQYAIAWKMGNNPINPYIQPRPDVRRMWLCNLYAARCETGSLVSPYP